MSLEKYLFNWKHCKLTIVSLLCAFCNKSVIEGKYASLDRLCKWREKNQVLLQYHILWRQYCTSSCHSDAIVTVITFFLSWSVFTLIQCRTYNPKNTRKSDAYRWSTYWTRMLRQILKGVPPWNLWSTECQGHHQRQHRTEHWQRTYT